jgi:hypothetical protein
VNVRLVVALALAVNAVAAAVSISRGLPADFGGFLNGDPNGVLGDFLTWRGTAIAPPLALMVVLAALAVAGSRIGAGIIWAGGVVGYLGEPQTWSLDPAATPLAAAGLLLYATLAAMGLGALRSRAPAQAVTA